jgi:multidrug efflux system membrane fusion protein
MTTLHNRSHSLPVPRRPRPFRLLLPTVAIAVLTAVAAACGGGPTQGFGGGGPVPVRATTVESRSVPLEIHAIGNVTASSTVDVNARIGGQLEEVHFTEGDRVTKGQLLFTIDQRPFQAAVRQAEARLAQDSAQLDKARADVRRYGELVKDDFVTKEQYDQAEASARALEAAVEGDRAALDEARLNLEYSTISAPITGRTGNLLVHAGNLVKANDKPLVTINRIQPVDVSFSVPERYLGRIRQRMAEQGRLPVRAEPGQDDPAVEGELDFVDNSVDQTTGTVLLKASFANADERLWPGEFVDAWLVLGEQADAVVVPTQAVQSGQEGTYVYVIRSDDTVDQRSIKVDRTFNGESVISDGLQPGERVVTDGQLRLTPGATVKIATESATTGSAAADAGDESGDSDR